VPELPIAEESGSAAIVIGLGVTEEPSMAIVPVLGRDRESRSPASDGDEHVARAELTREKRMEVSSQKSMDYCDGRSRRQRTSLDPDPCAPGTGSRPHSAGPLDTAADSLVQN
jgi:hypothetical protein